MERKAREPIDEAGEDMGVNLVVNVGSAERRAPKGGGILRCVWFGL